MPEACPNDTHASCDLAVGVGKLQAPKKFMPQMGLDVRRSSRGSEQRSYSPQSFPANGRAPSPPPHLVQASFDEAAGVSQKSGAANSWALGAFAPKSSEK